MSDFVESANGSFKHADTTWKHLVKDAIRKIAQTRPTFTVNDIWDDLIASKGRDAALDGTPCLRAMGGAILWAKREKLCEATGEYIDREFYRPNTHVAAVKVWKSLVYQA
jgi:hypothetical protein